MKILYYFKNLNTMMFQWQKYHIFDELRMHGVEIEVISPLDYPTIDEANAQLLKRAKGTHYDMFLTSFPEDVLYIDTLQEIKRLGIATVLFCPDNLTVPFRHKGIGKYFDLVWLTAQETEYLFKRWGCRTVFLPYAANPNFLKPVYGREEILRVGFVGTPHGSRIDRINTLIAGGVPVTIHSAQASVDTKLLKEKPSKYLDVLMDEMKYPIGRKLAAAAVRDKLFHRELNDPHGVMLREEPIQWENLAEMNCRYALVLSFTDAYSTGVLKHPVPIVNLRNFEIPMSGGIQYTTYTEELASYFEPDKEIILARNKEEYVDKAKFYLRPDNEKLRSEIRIAARKRAEAEHTWYARFSIIFELLNLPMRG